MRLPPVSCSRLALPCVVAASVAAVPVLLQGAQAPAPSAKSKAAGPKTSKTSPTEPTKPSPKTTGKTEAPPPAVTRSWEDVDRAIASRFAPTFYQGVIGAGRFDFIANFDFDGDWNGDNNWKNAADKQYPLNGWVYYSVSETPTHYFVHYAVFHPRDWKGGEKTGRVLSGTIRQGATVGGKVKPRGIADDIVLAHENDLEGCLVVAAKHGPSLEAARVVYVETVFHNRYLRFAPEKGYSEAEPLRLDGRRPLLFIEPKGHGIESYRDQPVRPEKPQDGAAGELQPDADEVKDADKKDGDKEDGGKKGGSLFGKMKGVTKVKGLVTKRLGDIEDTPTRMVVYQFSGTAGNPETVTGGPVGYDLKPLYGTFWTTASAGPNPTYGEAADYGTRTIGVVTGLKDDEPVVERKITFGTLGSALRGTAGARNKARPPWGWFDMGDRDRPLGEWFFDPANTVRRHLGTVKDWATAYLHQPFFGVIRGQMTGAAPAADAPAKVSTR